MSYVTLPYTELFIPAKGSRPAKVIHSPLLNTKLFFRRKETMFDFPSVVDSGADFCVFPAKYGSIIGVKIKQGDSIVTNGVGGRKILYFHKIKIGVYLRDQIWKFNADVGFSYKINEKGVGLLGRQGFFDQFREVVFNQNKRMFRIRE